MTHVIEVKIEDEHGAPVSGVRVYFTAGPQPFPDVAGLTGPDGSFTLSAPAAGTYGIAATADGFETREAEVAVRPGHPESIGLKLRLDRRRA